MVDDKLIPIVCDAEYIEKIGSLCLFCRSENIFGGDTDFDDIYVYRKVECNECRMEWEEVFTLTGTQPNGGK